MILFVIVLVLTLVFGLLGKIRRWSTPCKHGKRAFRGECADCVEEQEQLARTEQLEREDLERKEAFEQQWELLRRAEVRRLSLIRLQSARTYKDMNPREFEGAIAILFRQLGYQVKQTAFVRDGGKDLIAWKDGRKYVIECKRYGSRSQTGRRDLQILKAAKDDEHADAAIFVSTGRFSGPAVDYAARNEIELYDEFTFPDLVNRAYKEASKCNFARTICLKCGKESSVRLRRSGPATGVHFVENDGVCERHSVHTSIDLSQLNYPDLDVEAPWCHDHHVPMRRVRGYSFWGCPSWPQCSNRSYV